jgi:hypothetical protein
MACVDEADNRHRGLLGPRSTRPPSDRPPEQREHIASFHLVDLHSVAPASQGLDLQDIELAGISQRVSEPFHNLASR